MKKKQSYNMRAELQKQESKIQSQLPPAKIKLNHKYSRYLNDRKNISHGERLVNGLNN